MTGSTFGVVASFVAGALLLGIYGAAGRIGRRNQALRNAGVDGHGRHAGDWSFESVSAVLGAIDPARLVPGPAQSGVYDEATIAILEALPIERSADERVVEAVVGDAVASIPGGEPSAKEVRRSARRLERMHRAAHARWSSVEAGL